MAALLSLAACKRDDDPASPILGTWKFTGGKFISGANGTELATHTASNCEGQNTFVFKADGTAVETKYSLSGSNCVVDRTTNYTYSYNATTKELTLTENGGTPQTKEVIKLDNNTFEYVHFFYDQNGDGVLDKGVSIYTKVN